MPALQEAHASDATIDWIRPFWRPVPADRIMRLERMKANRIDSPMTMWLELRGNLQRQLNQGRIPLNPNSQLFSSVAALQRFRPVSGLR